MFQEHSPNCTFSEHHFYFYFYFFKKLFYSKVTGQVYTTKIMLGSAIIVFTTWIALNIGVTMQRTVPITLGTFELFLDIFFTIFNTEQKLSRKKKDEKKEKNKGKGAEIKAKGKKTIINKLLS